MLFPLLKSILNHLPYTLQPLYWPQASAGPLILTMSFYLLIETCGNFWISRIPHVGLDEPGDLVQAHLLSYLPLPVLPMSCWTCHQAESRVPSVHRHAQGSKPLTHFLDFPISVWILQLYTSNSSFHPEKAQEVSTLGLITSSCSLLFFHLLRDVRDGFFSFLCDSRFPYVPYPLHSCNDICSAPFLGAMVTDEVQERN